MNRSAGKQYEDAGNRHADHFQLNMFSILEAEAKAQSKGGEEDIPEVFAASQRKINIESYLHILVSL